MAVSIRQGQARKILEEGTTNDDALANRFSDKRYQDFSAAFALGPGEETQVSEPSFASDIIARFQANEFEVATGEQSDSMRIALFAERELPEVASQDVSNDTKWFTLMGQPPLRAVFEKALKLPSCCGQIDIDQQLVVFKQRSREVFGTDEISNFADPDVLQEVLTRYVVRSQLDEFNSVASSASIALTLLQS